MGKYAFEHFARIPVDVDIGSEFRYRDPIFNPGDIFIIISQSGETADTLAAMRMAKKSGARIIAITNVVGSTLAREADLVMYTGRDRKSLLPPPRRSPRNSCACTSSRSPVPSAAVSAKRNSPIISTRRGTPAQAERILPTRKTSSGLAAGHFNKTKAFFMGRLLTTRSAWKARSNSRNKLHPFEAFAAGELKHGPIALVDESTLVVAICTQRALFERWNRI